jgi:hypothetical protein
MRWKISSGVLAVAIALGLAIGRSPEAISLSSAQLVPSTAPLAITTGRSLSLAEELRVHGRRLAGGALGTGDPLPEPDFAEERAIHTTGEAAHATAVAGRTGAGPGPQVLSTTVGLSVTEGGSSPPDVQVGVSPTAVVEMVNTAVVFWRRNGNQLASPQVRTLESFISTASVDRRNDHVSDPRVFFDSVTGRWFALAFDVTRGETDLAISQTSEPTGSWVIWTFRSTGCPDQPRLAVTNDLVVITDDLFSNCSGGGFVGGEVTVISKAGLLAGSLPAGSVRSYGPDDRFKAITPAQPITPQNGAYMVSVANGSATAFLYTVTSPAATSIPIASIPIRRLTPPPPIQQAGTATAIDGGDNRVQNAIFDSGTIWFAATNSCQITGQAGLWGCARMEAIFPAAGRATEEQDLALAGQKHVFFPALASDGAGNLLGVFSFASGQDFAGVGTVTKLRQAGGFSNWTTVTQGVAPYVHVFGGRNRWGDYFGAARDPANPSVIWIAGEYTKANDSWGTTVAAVTAAPVTQAAPTVSTGGVTNVTATSVVVSGVVNTMNAPTQYRFEYGATTAYSAATSWLNLSASTQSSTVTATLSGLSPATTYHYRVVAQNSGGAAGGPDRTFTTAAPAATDTTAPTVVPKQASGRYGHKLSLAWSLYDNSNGSSMRIFVILGGKITSNWSEPAFRENGTYYVTWKAPAKPRGAARFCVIARDRAGNTSQMRCAGITLRR